MATLTNWAVMQRFETSEHELFYGHYIPITGWLLDVILGGSPIHETKAIFQWRTPNCNCINVGLKFN